MKVLEPGRKQKGWSTATRCTGHGNQGGGCGALLLVEYGDLFRTERFDMVGDAEMYVTFECPECGVLTDLPQVLSPLRPSELIRPSELPTLRNRAQSKKSP